MYRTMETHKNLKPLHDFLSGTLSYHIHLHVYLAYNSRDSGPLRSGHGLNGTYTQLAIVVLE
jgi:hypothetical protein